MKPIFPPDFPDFPSDEEISKAWKRAIEECQQKLREIGIRPQDDDENNDRNNWFYFPHRINSTTDAGICDQMWADHDNVDNICGRHVLEAEDIHIELPPNQIVNMATNVVDQYPGLSSHLSKSQIMRYWKMIVLLSKEPMKTASPN